MEVEDNVGEKQDLEQHSLALLGKHIRTCFSALFKIEPTLGDSQLSFADWRHEFERFSLWADNLGLYHRGHSSLDYRIREAEVLQDLIESLLSDLKGVLTDLFDLVKSVAQKSLTSDEEEKSLSNARDDEGSSPGSDISSDEYLDDYQDQSQEAALLKSAVDIIDRLYKFATKIRNPATRLASVKASTFKKIDTETRVDVLHEFEELDLHHVEEMLWDYRVAEANYDGNLPEAENDRSHRPRTLAEDDLILVCRLAKANTHRRRQFGYWRKHRAKNANETARALEETAEIPGLPDIAPKHRLNLFDILPGPSSKGLSRPSTATNLLDPTKFRFDDTTSTRSSRTVAPKAQGARDEQVEVPEPPTLSQEAKHFSCPYCFTLCSSSLLEKERWREHVFRDLRPYICTYVDCKAGDQRYDSWKDWAAHEQWSHNKLWRCMEHPEDIFCTRDEVNEHLKQVHSINNDLAESDRKALIEESTSNSVDRVCPFCLLATESTDILQIHIATHLQRIALFALPRSTDLKEGSSLGPGSLDIKSQDSRQGDLESLVWEDDEDSAREQVCCRTCENQWYRDEHRLHCPKCGSDFTEILEPGHFSNHENLTSDALQEISELSINEKSNARTSEYVVQQDCGLSLSASEGSLHTSAPTRLHRSPDHDPSPKESPDEPFAPTYYDPYDLDEKRLKQVLAEREKQLGAEHPKTLTSMRGLARIYKTQRRWKEAEDMFIQLTELRMRVLGAEHPDTWISMDDLASTYRDQGQWKEAEDLFWRVMVLKRRVLGAEHPDTLNSMNTLAVTYRDRGQWKEAEDLLVQVMELRKRVIGAEHPDTLNSMNELAVNYRYQGQWKEAEGLFRQVMELRKRVLGAEHPGTLNSMNTLAATYKDQGQWKEAEDLLVQVMEKGGMVGADHPLILQVATNLGRIYEDQGKLEEAKVIYQRTLDVEAFGPRDIWTLDTANNLANVYAKQFKLGEAEVMYRRVLDGYEEALGPKDLRTLDTATNLADVYKDQGKSVEAEAMYQQALDGYEEKLGLTDSWTRAVATNLANIYKSQARYDEAEKLKAKYNL